MSIHTQELLEHMRQEDEEFFNIAPIMMNETTWFNGTDGYPPDIFSAQLAQPPLRRKQGQSDGRSFWEKDDGDENHVFSLPEELMREVRQDWASTAPVRRAGDNNVVKEEGEDEDIDSQERDFPVQFDDDDW
jgi:hypothetical protein